jgi:hypothetical protein
MVGVIVLGVPLMTLANAAEYRVSGIIVSRTIGCAAALRIAVLSTAANLLPLPGGPLVRVKGLVDEGERPPRAVAVTLVMGGAWLATSLLVAGLFADVEPEIAGLLIGVGMLVGATVVAALVRLIRKRRAPLIAMVGGVELAATLATGFRMWLVALALGFDLGSGALVLGVAPVLGAAVVIVPAGLGVRELIASLAAPAVGLDPAAGFLIASVDRLAGMLVHGLAAFAIAVGERRTPKAGVT